MEELYGRAGRVLIMDRGLASEKNVRFLRAGGRCYILGTAKNSLRKFERDLLSEDWKQVHEGLEVRLVPAPDGEEVFPTFFWINSWNEDDLNACRRGSG